MLLGAGYVISHQPTMVVVYPALADYAVKER